MTTADDCQKTPLPCMLILGKIDGKLDEVVKDVTDHEKRIRPLEANHIAAKAAGAWEGKKWGAIIGTAVSVVAAVGAKLASG